VGRTDRSAILILGALLAKKSKSRFICSQEDEEGIRDGLSAYVIGHTFIIGSM
jgi:hypothetical protein